MPAAVLRAIVSADTTTASAKLAAFGKQLDTVAGKGSTNMAKLGAAAKIGFAVAGVAAAAFAVKAIGAASDLNEQMNRTVVVFGKSSKAVVDFAANAAKIGIAKTEALEAAASFGTMFQTAGLATQASADMSVKIVKLSADMASFNNQDPTEMLDRMRSGLAGEARPLRQFGVFLSEAAVKNEAYRSGIAKTGKELTDAQKVQARYNLILQQTTKQQGDFARTIGTSLPNQIRVAKAEFENLSASIGTALLPVATALLKVGVAIIEFFNMLPGPVKTATVVLVALGGTLVGLGIAVGVVRTALGNLGVGMGQAAVAAEGLAAAETHATVATSGLGAALGSAGLLKWLGPVAVGAGTAAFVIKAAGDNSKHATQQIAGLTQSVKDHKINQDLVNQAIERYPALAFQNDIRRVKDAMDSQSHAAATATGATSDLDAASRAASGGLGKASRAATALVAPINAVDAAALAANPALDDMRNSAGLLGSAFRNATDAVAAFIHQAHELQGIGVVPLPGGTGRVTLAQGGIVRAAHGLIVNRPTMIRPNVMAGEAGAEAVIPLNSRGIGILAQALTQAIAASGIGGGGPSGDIVIQIEHETMARIGRRKELQRTGGQ